MSPVLKGTIEVRVNVRQNGQETKKPGEAGGSFQIIDSPPTIVLDWRKIRGKENLSTISNVSVNGLPVILNPDSSQYEVIISGREGVNFFEFNEHLVFTDGVKPGENVIKLDYTSPIATSGAAVTRYVDKEDGAEYIYSLFVPSDASTAFPAFDQPDLKARFSLTIKTSGNWKVISNTEAKEIQNLPVSHSEDAGKGLYETAFKETQPISTYVFAFAAGDFVDIKQARATQNPTDISTIIYVRKSQVKKITQHIDEVFRLNGEAVKYLESYFDYKFPFPKYDLVLIPEFPFGGMEHAGATFLRESSVIFPQEPTANDYISRGNLIFHEAAHQWFGDTVTMRWFDDLWLKEGFAEFMAYKTMERVLPQYNAWKAFYERNKPLAYLTDSTRGTTPIYQEIPNLSSAKSAYGNIVYRKAPSFLKQAEFYLGEKEFQTAIRKFLKKHEFANARWEDLVSDFARVKYNLPESGGEISAEQMLGTKELLDWANGWIKQRGVPIIKLGEDSILQKDAVNENSKWIQKIKIYTFEKNPNPLYKDAVGIQSVLLNNSSQPIKLWSKATFIFPNYEDYGYGIFLLDEKSRNYILANIQNEKDDFLRSMMWGALWDSVREAELNPKDYVELAVKNISGEKDELTIQTILSRVSTAMNYYLSEKQSAELAPRLEKVLLERMNAAETLGQRIVFYRAFLNLAASAESRQRLKEILSGKSEIQGLKLKTKDKFDIVARLLILNDADAPKLLEDLAKTETSDEAKRYAYAARAGIATAENKGKFFADFLNNKEISESYIESAAAPFNSVRHAEMTLPFLEKAIAELPNLKRTRKIFFVNNWLGAFIGGQRSEQALAIVNKFLADNPNLDRDLRLKILENVDGLERGVKIRKKFAD